MINAPERFKRHTGSKLAQKIGFRFTTATATGVAAAALGEICVPRTSLCNSENLACYLVRWADEAHKKNSNQRKHPLHSAAMAFNATLYK